MIFLLQSNTMLNQNTFEHMLEMIIFVPDKGIHEYTRD